MLGWQPIEKMVLDDPVWVLKYDIFFTPDGNFCEEDTPGARKSTNCHGFYKKEADAIKAQRHLLGVYRIEKVWQRVLL